MAKADKNLRNGKSAPSGAYLTADERAARGRALRDTVPRSSHSGWTPAADRRDPVTLLEESNAGRMMELVPIRFGRMSASPFAFYRGSAAIMAADLAGEPTSDIRVQACGDAHLMNFGGFATPERNIIFDINDLDETLPAPFEWDLKRLAASIVIAADHLALPKGDAARVVTDAVREYRERMHNYGWMRALDVWYDRIDLQKYEDRSGDPDIVAAARKRLAERIVAERRKSVPEHLYPKLVSAEGEMPRIKDEPPLIFHPSEDLAPGAASGYEEAIAAYRDSLADHTRVLFNRFHFFDLAVKVVGVGSVGTMCGVGLFMAADNDPLFLQVKEARASVLEPYAGRSVYPNHGQRVIVGQRLMQSASDVFLGWTRGKNGRDFYIRQLRDMKMSAVIEDWDAGLLRQYGRMCAHALARAHARSGDAAMIAGYMGSGRTFDDAICEFATEYCSQNRSDYRAFIAAIREGRIEAKIEES
ncbi:DUF2252 domain-containing protein [Cupriavidus taiwanensis]|uniref:DUF2252 domain-containing protein n=1 Tax=Cupriavidus taiwanensis (strain DSM 17343 / BCRC 17206 / CCUG 44338 / CIP 107171 / LMG 19424 / R1) TaxID=977880 RepID=B3R8E7_CUPTR|nr:DUF2252 domain-containing protein [Cupriavidus taiwanensis]CAQ71303.1 conserved hypothetical protein [Cupriavidus taiwanensis LMG 19424]SOY72907.1 conserved hypothetical protein [Cupriavidus taiwanensis]